MRSRAAASSIASGSPSSRRQISTMDATFSSVTAKPGRTAAARSRSNCTDGYAKASAAETSAAGRRSGGTGRSASPRMPSGSREVASTRSRGHRASSSSASRAAASMTCSQLSSTRSVSASANTSTSRPTVSRGLTSSMRVSRPRRPDGVEHRPGHVGGVGDRRQLDQPDAAADALGEPGRGDRGEPGLARAARADQGDQPVLGELLGDLAQLLVATDETGERGAQVAEAGRRRFGLAAQHRQVGGAQLGGRVGAELVGQAAAERLVGRERLGRPPGRGERLEPQRAEAFPQRVVAGELFELGDQGGRPAETQLRLDPVFDGGQPQLVEAGRGGDRVAGLARVGVRRSAPEREPVPQGVGRGLRVAGAQRVPAGAGELLEALGVDRRRRRAGSRPVRRPTRAPGTVRRRRETKVWTALPWSAGGRVGPEGVDERVDADHPAGVGGQPGQQRAQPRPADLDGGVVNRHLERAEDPHLHGSTLSPARIRSL